ncbi:auxilin-like clathrin-binding protein required for normal clathrin function [Neofusicoccum ribis]|uniref:Auxilin-like clathrin-binding protein required for normal clathrin function n=1 Tax=Neofusicoccum ribis TaxID=45134 RepID=A0ABR3SZK7_9PEZI
MNTKPQPQPQPQPTSTPSFPSLNPSPLPSLSRGSTPLSTQPSGAAPTTTFRGIKAPSKPSTPANDSFSSLLASKSSKPANNLSLQERQRQLQEEKEKQRKQLESQFGAPDNAFWDSLGSGRSTPNATAGAPSPAPQPALSSLSNTINRPFAAINAPADRASPAAAQDEDDILAAFNSAAPVDASSHYPVPPAPASRGGTPSQVAGLGSNGAGAQEHGGSPFGDDDDDPFGLSQLPSRPAAQPSQPATSIDQDDDILGDLAKPVSELPPRQSEVQHKERERNGDRSDAANRNDDPRDAAVAELVDMGFPAGKSAEALAHTDSGTDIQAAVGWLLSQAHDEAKQKSRQRQEERGRASPLGPESERHRSSSGRNNRNEHAGESVPAWMREQGSRSSSQRRNEGRTPTEEKDVTQMAQEFGTSFLKSANTFWKQSQKKVQKAVAEFQQDGDPSQPKWMREAQSHATGDGPARRNQSKAEKQATDEAMMLESDMGRPQKPARTSRAPRPDLDPSDPRSRGQSPASAQGSHRSTPPPRLTQDARQSSRGPIGKLSREDVEEQSAQAYVTPSVTPKQSVCSQVFTWTENIASAQARQLAIAIPAEGTSATDTPGISKQKGTEAFKRGDYAAAHTDYTSALQPLPSGHPIAIIILCNRALTNIKVGDPKAAVADADLALSTIGPSRGDGEKIAMGGAEGEKEMKDFFGKALMRKAEALENMEKWGDAAKVWKDAVEAGVGGSVSIQGRNRCEKAAGGGSQQASRPAAPRPATAAKKPAARPPPRPNVSAAASAEAVKKLREANAAAEKADDEKFALTDHVDAKLVAWKGSKSDNLRALLGSLDTVLWPEAGWKKVGMQDLVMPNKVKIVYMKAIAKVHPDKIPQSATTEQRMISGAVFATLNEAWDKFKKDNNL